MKKTYLFVLAGTLVLAGCGTREAEIPASPGDIVSKVKKQFEENNPPEDLPMAGVKRDTVPHDKWAMIESANLVFASRRNPFALFGDEMAFETSIRYNIILSKLAPPYSILIEEGEREVPESLRPVDPQPYRRASGILLGETVKAVIVEGQRRYFVSPGDFLEGTDWMVLAITGDSVILVREESKRPNRMVVRLESAPFDPSQPEPGTGGGGGGRVGTPGTGDAGGGGRAGDIRID